MKSQKNILFDILLENGLAMNDFKFENAMGIESKQVTRLVHLPSNYYFTFDYYEGTHFCKFAPGSDKLEDSEHTGSWAQSMNTFNAWIVFLQREI